MAEVAQRYQDRLPEIKKNIENWFEAFTENNRRFHEFMRFVFKTGLTQTEIDNLQEVGKPTIEFNILEPYLSRQRMSFIKNPPEPTTEAAPGIQLSQLTQAFLKTIEVVNDHLRTIVGDAKTALPYRTFTFQTGGGYSAIEVFTKYVNERSMEQNIHVAPTDDPTLNFFDWLARESHKGDGRFCGKLYPMTEAMFTAEFGKDIAAKMTFTKSVGKINWAYNDRGEKIILVADYFEKRRKKEKIIKLSNGAVVTPKEYKNAQRIWEEQGRIEQFPLPTGKERWTYMTYIDRYRICQSGVLSYEETDYRHLPWVFVDGNSVPITEGNDTSQVTRPFCYHAQGIQRLKTFAGQSLANELENLVQHKWVAAVEGIPNDYKEAYLNVQKADVLLYNHFLDTNNPDVVVPPPREVERPPIPPELTNTFRVSDEMTQAILGSYNQGTQYSTADLSGVAIDKRENLSNQSIDPYRMGYIEAMQRVAEIVVDLIPKYYRTPRSLPVLKANGKRDYVIINKVGNPYMNYDPNSLQISIDCRASFATQKEVALATLISLMQASETFAQFMNSKGMPMLIDNLDIRGIDELKEQATEFMQEMQQSQQMQQKVQQQQMQMQQQQAQLQMAQAQKVLQSPTSEQVKIMQIQNDAQYKDAELALQQQAQEDNFIQILANVRNNEVDKEIEIRKVDAEESRTAVESALAIASHMRDDSRLEQKGV